MNDIHELKFRILKRGNWRMSFRLEQIYWQVLQEAAEANGLKLADYIKDILTKTGEVESNNSSLLRVHALSYIVKKIDSYKTICDLPNIISTALSAPVPCFVLSSTKKLIGFNQEFSKFVISISKSDVDRDVLQTNFILAVPIKRLVEILTDKKGGAVTCEYAIKSPNSVVGGKARITLVPGQLQPVILGYIIDGSTV